MSYQILEHSGKVPELWNQMARTGSKCFYMPSVVGQVTSLVQDSFRLLICKMEMK